VVDESGAFVLARGACVVARRGAQRGPERQLPEAPAGLDRQFEIAFPAPEADSESAAPAAWEYAVRAEGSFHGEPFARAAAGGFFVHSPGGKLRIDGARVEKDGADLALTLQARIDRSGTYWAYAELWGGPGGEAPIAFARD